MRAHQVFIAALACSLLSGASPPDLLQSPEKVVMDYLAAWNMHDAPGAAGHLAYDVTYFDPSGGQTVSGRDATRTAVLANFINTAPDAIWMLRGDSLVDGDKVAVEWEFTGTNTGMPAERHGTDRQAHGAARRFGVPGHRRQDCLPSRLF